MQQAQRWAPRARCSNSAREPDNTYLGPVEGIATAELLRRCEGYALLSNRCRALTSLPSSARRLPAGAPHPAFSGLPPPTGPGTRRARALLRTRDSRSRRPPLAGRSAGRPRAPRRRSRREEAWRRAGSTAARGDPQRPGPARAPRWLREWPRRHCPRSAQRTPEASRECRCSPAALPRGAGRRPPWPWQRRCRSPVRCCQAWRCPWDPRPAAPSRRPEGCRLAAGAAGLRRAPLQLPRPAGASRWPSSSRGRLRRARTWCGSSRMRSPSRRGTKSDAAVH
mmetsp:Transcript_38620/g.120043  ORF Transcript_38620/g.120043 Transcript_38620/m.120043 type:complete len:281 (+) Transcript_38620:2123-2965(+)